MTAPDLPLSKYRPMYDYLMQQHYRGVQGVLAVESEIPGPVAAILACTHGNEPAGLGAIDYLLSDLHLRCGTLLCIIVNPLAAQAYFSAQTDLEQQNARYIDHNMNRVPSHIEQWAHSVEGDRLSALMPILETIDGGVLDLHSTSADAPSMLITVDDAGCDAARCGSAPFEHVISNITPFLSGRFLIETCVNAPLKLLAECGQHHCPDAGNRAIDMSLAFLNRLGMLQETHRPAINPQKHCYRVEHAFRLPETPTPFRLLKHIAPFEWVDEGQKLVCNGDTQVAAPIGGYAVMCPNTEGPLCSKEALLFICSKES